MSLRKKVVLLIILELIVVVVYFFLSINKFPPIYLCLSLIIIALINLSGLYLLKSFYSQKMLLKYHFINRIVIIPIFVSLYIINDNIYFLYLILFLLFISFIFVDIYLFKNFIKKTEH